MPSHGVSKRLNTTAVPVSIYHENLHLNLVDTTAMRLKSKPSRNDAEVLKRIASSLNGRILAVYGKLGSLYPYVVEAF